MSIESHVKDALERAWASHGSDSPGPLVLNADIVESASLILATDSAPYRQFLLTIAAGTADDPSSNPASLQLTAGVDRRGQAQKASGPLSEFITLTGLKLKFSRDPGVSNQWREPEINQAWVDGRRASYKPAAAAFLRIVNWLKGASNVNETKERASQLLDFVARGIVTIAAENALDYPRFRATPRIAMSLVESFLESAPDRPDAMEAVVTVGARELSKVLASPVRVERRDINSPDPIDVLLTSSGADGVRSGIEVTDTKITLSKIQHEVVKAMLDLGLDRATVVSRGVSATDADEIEAYVRRANTHFQQQIDLVTIEIIESWLSFPGTPRTLATDFLWGIGDELDRFSKRGNRLAWFDVLRLYAESIE